MARAQPARELPEPETPRPQSSTADRSVRISLSRHDLVLASIPLAFAVALLVTAVGGVPLQFGVVGASLLGLGVIVDGVYRNPPVPERR